MAATAVGARELYDVHARPFDAAFRLVGLASVMPSYSEFDGVPISASHAVLTDMLRGRMGFMGTTGDRKIKRPFPPPASAHPMPPCCHPAR